LPTDAIQFSPALVLQAARSPPLMIALDLGIAGLFIAWVRIR
jgi:hypothetical protein